MAAPSLEKRLSAAADDSINQLGGSFRGSSMRVEKSKPAPGGWCQGICGGVPPKEREVDVILIGAGVMSATVGLMLKELEPNWKMMMFERLGAPGEESSNGFNNAGTGHAGFMEPNYTKEVKNSDGSLKTVTTDKVEHVCEQFLSSRQYWDYLTKTGKLPKPDTWIHQTNHIALGVGKDQVEFIKKRYEAMKSHPLFSSMEICLPEEKEKAKQWAPLIVKGRDPTEPICMTKVSHGTDVDYGALTKAKITAFQELGGDLRLHTEVTDLKKNKDGKWVVTTKVNGAGSGWAYNKAKFVFVGAGGWALLMLQKAGIPEVNGYMALPVTGDWAICQNPEAKLQRVEAPTAEGAESTEDKEDRKLVQLRSCLVESGVGFKDATVLLQAMRSGLAGAMPTLQHVANSLRPGQLPQEAIELAKKKGAFSLSGSDDPNINLESIRGFSNLDARSILQRPGREGREGLEGRDGRAPPSAAGTRSGSPNRTRSHSNSPSRSKSKGTSVAGHE